MWVFDLAGCVPFFDRCSGGFGPFSPVLDARAIKQKRCQQRQPETARGHLRACLRERGGHLAHMQQVKDTLRATVRMGYDGRVHKTFRGPDAEKRFATEVKVLKYLEEK